MFGVADAGYCPVKLGMMSTRLQSGVNTLQGFREDKRNRITQGKSVPPKSTVLHVAKIRDTASGLYCPPES